MNLIVKEDAQKYFSEQIISSPLELNHKGNNRLFKVETGRGTFLLKKYSDRHLDNWKRGQKEFEALAYLWEKGFRDIPQPFSFFSEENVGIYSFEYGRTLLPSEVTEKEIRSAVDFLVRLHSLTGKENFSPASSACLNLMEYQRVIDRRISRMVGFVAETENEKMAFNFLNTHVIPKAETLGELFFNKARDQDLETELPIEKQVLTPADFGFHNIIVNGNQYKFVDFEYFGRDDPARQILDFYHHDKSSELSFELRDLFMSNYKKSIKAEAEFERRIKLIDPLIQMTWVLIYINFLSLKQKDHLKFAQGNVESIIGERLVKARKKLEKIVV